MATGATIAVAVIVLAPTLLSPPKAEAQSASAPGGVSMVVSPCAATSSGGGANAGGGIITMQDSVNRKVTVVCYSCEIISALIENGSTNTSRPIILLSTNATFTY